MSQSIEEVLLSLAGGSAGRRRLRAPSRRNQQIAEEVRVLGRTQAAVGAAHGLSQRRVSQICQQVARWEGQSDPSQRGELAGQARQQAEAVLASRQVQEIYRRAMRAFDQSAEPLKTRRQGTRADGKEWSEESHRQQRLDSGSLRLALRAVEQRQKLAGQEPPENWEENGLNQVRGIVSQLCEFLQEAEKRGDACASYDPTGRVWEGTLRRQKVERCLRELLLNGRDAEGCASTSKPAAASRATSAAAAARSASPSAYAQRIYIDPSGRAHLLHEPAEGAAENGSRRGEDAETGDRVSGVGDRESGTEYSVLSTKYSVPSTLRSAGGSGFEHEHEHEDERIQNRSPDPRPLTPDSRAAARRRLE